MPTFIIASAAEPVNATDASSTLFLNAAPMLYSVMMDTFPLSSLDIWNDVQAALGGESFQVSGAEINQVIIVEDAPTPYVIKIPYDDKVAERACLSEMEMCRLMADISETTDLSFPTVLGDWRGLATSSDRRVFSVLSFVPGMTAREYMGSDHVSDEGKRQLGASVGAFVAWMSQEFSLEHFASAAEKPLPHLLDNVLERVSYEPYILSSHGLNSLTGLLKEISTRPDAPVHPIVGHNDLHPGNLLITDPKRPVLTGVIDLETIRPTYPEEELKNLLYMGSIGLEAGVSAYEEKSGREVSRELLEHSLLSRWVASCAYCVMHKRAVPDWVMSMARDIGPRPDLEEIKGYNASLQSP